MWARSLLSAMEFGQLCPSRALWWIGSLIGPENIPAIHQEGSRRTSLDLAMHSSLRTSVRERGPGGIIETIGVWLSMTGDNVRWERLCRAVECEALDRLFAWPLVIMEFD